jgi:hypothetical protein
VFSSLGGGTHGQFTSKSERIEDYIKPGAMKTTPCPITLPVLIALASNTPFSSSNEQG